ncbi:UDP-N-acetylmuramoyl-L-alanyl-D-glutamate--2,6-diaminopimelate ligase [Nakamurella antarctica]|uniref:UDP-N-acetylmuramoyl-L-alanyl-D-glutamate--2, 6-diaminopimelate ligase n=1 Tax=Nakamurella antarctica TaxID=1902245 RepID=UPI0019CFAF62|nr:UDP-N-acetylmuramoyl-L-alanyl-D-glutamate--2,6-diaminopimelate ligase [Nakamurella antarctica]
MRRTVGASVVPASSGALSRTSGDNSSNEEPLGEVVTGITLRSGEVLPGDVFAAVVGSKTHGARSIPEAVAAGAVAVLTDQAGAEIAAEYACLGVKVPTVLVVSDPRVVLGAAASMIYRNPSEKLTIIGVTGTSGKTTITYLVEAGLRACGQRTGVIGTVETRIGDEVVPSDFTTPEAPDLQALLAVMVQAGVQSVAMEVSSHALALGRVAGIEFAVGAFTNLSQDHLDFHGDMESYFQAKELLFDGRSRAGVVDIDDEYGRRLAAGHPEFTTVSAAGATADWQLEHSEVAPSGVSLLKINGPADLTVAVALALPGTFNISNTLIALGAVAAAGFDPVVAAAAISGVVVPGRMQAVDGGQSFLAVVDYAHKPAALKAVLSAIRESVRGKVIVVFGAGGDRDIGKRQVMGSVAGESADLIYVTDDNPRSEDPASIRQEIMLGALTHPNTAGRLHEIGDRRQAIRAAVAAAVPGDAVVIAGKGHELGQYVGEKIIPFSDVAELTAALVDARAKLITNEGD